MTRNRPSPRVMVASGILFILLPILMSGFSFADDSMKSAVAGLSPEEAVKIGERMYRDGILSSGEPMRALVQGDVPVDSTMFSCVSCHLRSGLGSLEGQVVTYPVDGITLFNPITKAWNMRWVSGSKYARAMTGVFRSAYNDETLATAIRGGVNPDGKVLNYTMPRYPLSDKDMAIMIFYLKNLSVKPSPGVGDNVMRFATVVTEGVRGADIDEMMTPLKVMEGASNFGNRTKMARLSLASDPDNLMNKGYIKVSVARWDLKGPQESWRSQLDNYYKKEPVFALIGGLSNDDWKPVHKFCEDENIPCILPIVDLPVISTTDWYTVNFSKGLYQEGEAVAKYLQTNEDMGGVPVIEVYRDNDKGRAMANGFEEKWRDSNGQKIDKRILSKDEVITEEFWTQISTLRNNAVVLVWLDSKDISAISKLADAPDKIRMIFLSSSLLGHGMSALPDKLRKLAYITFPYRLPEDFLRNQPLPRGSAVRNLTLADYTIVRGKANLDVMVVTKSIFMLKGYFNRDRFLEVVDMMKDEVMTPLYPRLSFGPGQRYLSKGCYIVQLGDGRDPKITGVSDWVVQE